MVIASEKWRFLMWRCLVNAIVLLMLWLIGYSGVHAIARLVFALLLGITGIREAFSQKPRFGSNYWPWWHRCSCTFSHYPIQLATLLDIDAVRNFCAGIGVGLMYMAGQVWSLWGHISYFTCLDLERFVLYVVKVWFLILMLFSLSAVNWCGHCVTLTSRSKWGCDFEVICTCFVVNVNSTV